MPRSRAQVKAKAKEYIRQIRAGRRGEPNLTGYPEVLNPADVNATDPDLRSPEVLDFSEQAGPHDRGAADPRKGVARAEDALNLNFDFEIDDENMEKAFELFRAKKALDSDQMKAVVADAERRIKLALKIEGDKLVGQARAQARIAAQQELMMKLSKKRSMKKASSSRKGSAQQQKALQRPTSEAGGDGGHRRSAPGPRKGRLVAPPATLNAQMTDSSSASAQLTSNDLKTHAQLRSESSMQTPPISSSHAQTRRPPIAHRN